MSPAGNIIVSIVIVCLVIILIWLVAKRAIDHIQEAKEQRRRQADDVENGSKVQTSTIPDVELQSTYVNTSMRSNRV